ncbi:pyoverdine/dityrosine biosynthesis family protein, partial [Aspergillus sclerotiicarbonarius CBS 121057]
SFYARAVACYIRSHQGDLVRTLGHDSASAQGAWPTIRPMLVSQTPTNSWCVLPSIICNGVPVSLYELHRQQQVLGVIVRTPGDTSEFDRVFARFLLTHLESYATQLAMPMVCHPEPVSSRLVDLCESELLFQPPNSQWQSRGRVQMLEMISFFTARQLPILMCLPAFPCKSSNPDKVGCHTPDRGEELALRRLHQVLHQMQGIYEPGASICVISDGHIFSDCIGVDDKQVDAYGTRLQELNRVIGGSNSNRITFLALPDLLRSGQDCQNLQLQPLQHCLSTEISAESETCRQMLMQACQTSVDTLRSQIVAQDPTVLALHRGFSRFMLEDLQQHPNTQGLSRNQRKKLAEKASFEIMLRNQAYSNLVELFLPHFIRLSIHSHVNSGPKFGIRLFDRASTRVVGSLDDLANVDISQASPDLLHIPTPWHNCIFQFAGQSGMFVAKAKVVGEAIRTGQVEGEWIPGDLAAGRGAYFALRWPELPKLPTTAVTEQIFSGVNSSENPLS